MGNEKENNAERQRNSVKKGTSNQCILFGWQTQRLTKSQSNATAENKIFTIRS